MNLPNRPRLKLSETGLSGWDALDQWGRFNSAEWIRVTLQAKESGLDEEERLRLLIDVLLARSELLQSALLDNALMNPRIAIAPTK